MNYQISELYAAGMSTASIGIRVGVSGFTVLKMLRAAGVPIRNVGHKRYDVPLTSAQLEIIEGELLGDGSIPKIGLGYKNARFSWGGVVREHGELLASVLGIYGLKVCPYKRHMRTDGYSMSSRCAPVFTKLRAKWYPEGKKRVPPDLELTGPMIRHWYIGDGSIRRRPGRKLCLRLSTDCFPIEEVDLLRAKLGKLGVNTSRHVGGYKKLPVIYVSTSSVPRFFEITGPCTVAWYKYKWPYEAEMFARKYHAGYVNELPVELPKRTGFGFRRAQ